MSVTRSTWVDDDGTGELGTIVKNSELQKIYDNVDGETNNVVVPSLLTYKTGALKQDFNHDHPINLPLLPPQSPGYGHKPGSARILSGLLASRPAPELVGRLFFATDLRSAFLDNATSWLSFGASPLGIPIDGFGGTIDNEGDVIFSSSQSISGYHLYDSVVVNAGVILTVDDFAVLYAINSITIAGTINANGQGMAGGAGGTAPSGPGKNGQSGSCGAGGGGGFGSGAGADGGDGGDFTIGSRSAGSGAGGGPGNPGSNAGALSASSKRVSVLNRLQLKGGSGGGGGGGSSIAPGGNGGRGGGTIILVSPLVDVLGSGDISANGANGQSVVPGGGGGGGGGLIYIGTQNYVNLVIFSVPGGVGGTGANDGGIGADGVFQVELF